ncbi:MAG: tetratricopeptide repeat protein, partial [Paraglaciecola sp.]|nr:tetratricopeptide repeat protein [Paraglaciecola sp.]
ASYIRQQQFDKAFVLADEWLKTPDTVAAGHNLKALASILTENFDEANRQVDSALSQEKDNVLAKYLKATIVQKDGDNVEALKILKELIAIKPDYQPALIATYNLSKTMNEDINPLIEQLKDSYQKQPENLQLLSVLISIFQKERMDSDIINILEPMFRTSQQQPAFVYSGLADAYMMQNNLPLALEMTERWFNVNPNNPSAALAYVNLLANNQKTVEALKVLDKLINDFPDEQNLKLFKFDLLGSVQNYSAAIAYYDKLPKTVQNEPQALAQLGRFYIANKQVSVGITKLEQAYRTAPLQNILISLAEAMKGSNPNSKIVELIEKHRNTVGDSVELSMYLANLLIEDDTDKAIKIYGETLEKAQDNPYVLNNYAWLLAEKGETAQALTHIKQALKIEPDHPDIIDTYGKVLSLNKEYDAAIDQFKKSLTIRPNHPEVLLNYADALAAKGLKTDAKELLKNFTPQSLAQQKQYEQIMSMR